VKRTHGYEMTIDNNKASQKCWPCQ
jgi:hypothetical protein